MTAGGTPCVTCPSQGGRARSGGLLLTCWQGCGTFVELTASIAPGAVWSKAAIRSAVALSRQHVPVDSFRRTFGVDWSTVMRAVRHAAEGAGMPVADGEDR
jgi:transposase-like protein